MKVTGIEAGVAASPAIDNCGTVYRYDSQLYIKSGSDDLQALKEAEVVQFFASVNPGTYKLVAITNPTLKMFFDLAKRICEVEG